MESPLSHPLQALDREYWTTGSTSLGELPKSHQLHSFGNSYRLTDDFRLRISDPDDTRILHTLSQALARPSLIPVLFDTVGINGLVISGASSKLAFYLLDVRNEANPSLSSTGLKYFDRTPEFIIGGEIETAIALSHERASDQERGFFGDLRQGLLRYHSLRYMEQVLGTDFRKIFYPPENAAEEAYVILTGAGYRISVGKDRLELERSTDHLTRSQLQYVEQGLQGLAVMGRNGARLLQGGTRGALASDFRTSRHGLTRAEFEKWEAEDTGGHSFLTGRFGLIGVDGALFSGNLGNVPIFLERIGYKWDNGTRSWTPPNDPGLEGASFVRK
ncbi:MAG: hypothetical protein KDD70_16300 [Bdellovibrionales bacterium]|nr:hypothetical protein [Bdellovibrionales bacterium]